jgi:flagellar basal-body rod protein FlgB
MFSDWLDSPAISVLNQALSFTERRHDLILQNLANYDTVGYQEQDVSVAAFEHSLQDAIAQKRRSNADTIHPRSTRAIDFNDDDTVTLHPNAITGQVYHDRSVHSIEGLMSQMADNAEAHNTITTLLKNRYDITNEAIRMRV